MPNIGAPMHNTGFASHGPHDGVRMAVAGVRNDAETVTFIGGASRDGWSDSTCPCLIEPHPKEIAARLLGSAGISRLNACAPLPDDDWTAQDDLSH